MPMTTRCAHAISNPWRSIDIGQKRELYQVFGKAPTLPKHKPVGAAHGVADVGKLASVTRQAPRITHTRPERGNVA